MPSHPFRWTSAFSRPWPDPREASRRKTQASSNRRLIERYLKIRASRLAPSSLGEYRRDLACFGKSLTPEPLLAAKPEQVAAWFTANMRVGNHPGDDRPWSIRTAHRRRVAVYWFYEWARWEGLIVRNPVEFIELPLEYRHVPTPLSRGVVDQIFEHIEATIDAHGIAPERLYLLDAAAFRLMDRLALRVSEAAHIRISQLTTVDGELRAWVHKKGNKDKIYPITGIVWDAFSRWLSVRETLAPCSGHEDFVFLNPYTGRCVTRYELGIRLRLIARAAGVDPMNLRVLTPTALRRNRARALLRDGWRINSVQSVLDHGSIRTTQIYLEETEGARMQSLRAVSMANPLPPESVPQPFWTPAENNPPRAAPNHL